MAGLTPIWGIEHDPDIAAIAELNGTPVTICAVESVDFTVLEAPDWLHMSPPCINASVAKADAGEAPEDIEMAQGCINMAHLLNIRPGLHIGNELKQHGVSSTMNERSGR